MKYYILILLLLILCGCDYKSSYKAQIEVLENRVEREISKRVEIEREIKILYLALEEDIELEEKKLIVARLSELISRIDNGVNWRIEGFTRDIIILKK